MHPTTAQYLAQARNRDLEADAANARLVAEARQHESEGLPPTRWGIHLPRFVPTFRRGQAVGVATR